MKYTSPTESQTHSIARQLASMLHGGEIITLTGELGAGKTTFTKGLAPALDVDDTVTSPTFTLMNIYQAHHETIETLVHIDTYRLEHEDDLIQIGVEDYLGQPDVVTIIEWPEKLSTLLKHKKTIDISIEHTENSERTITISNLEE